MEYMPTEDINAGGCSEDEDDALSDFKPVPENGQEIPISLACRREVQFMKRQLIESLSTRPKSTATTTHNGLA